MIFFVLTAGLSGTGVVDFGKFKCCIYNGASVLIVAKRHIQKTLMVKDSKVGLGSELRTRRSCIYNDLQVGKRRCVRYPSGSPVAET